MLACGVGTVLSFWRGWVTYEHFPYVGNETLYMDYQFEYEISSYASSLVNTLIYENMEQKYIEEVLDAQMQNAYLAWKEAKGNLVFEKRGWNIVESYYTDQFYEEQDQVQIYEEYTGGESSTSVALTSPKETDSSVFTYKAFETAYPNLREDLKSCMEENLKAEYESSKRQLQKTDSSVKVEVVKATQKKKADEMIKTYQSYPIHLLYQDGKEEVKIGEEDPDTVSYFGNQGEYASEGSTANEWQYSYLDMSHISLSLDRNSEDFYELSNYQRQANDVYKIYDQWKKQEVQNVLASYQIGIGIDADMITQQEASFNETKEASKQILFNCAMMIAVALVAFIYLIAVAGKRVSDNEVHLNLLDSIWSEVQWIAVFSLTVAGVCGFAVTGPSYYYEEGILASTRNPFLDLFGHPKADIMIAVGTVLVVMGIMALILSQVRLLKARKWWNGFICIRIIKWIWKKVTNICGTIWRGGRLMNRMAVIAVVVPIISGTWIGIPFMIAGLLYLVYRYVPDFEKLQKGVKRIKEGDLAYQIPIEHESVIKEVAEDVNRISEGLKGAISSELRSERMKAELISNVSHDIKTPLTSIITYVDLLKQEDIQNDTAKDYIAVIDKKAQRLKVLTEDLFEAAKASSGDMPVNWEKVNVQSLVHQALGEFGDKLEYAELTLRLTMPEEPISILADGRLMWRVLSNTLSNVVKYAQKGSRVYLDVIEEADTSKVCFVLKNISEYELNISAEELMERFTRGDESRSTEGSGLGLNIANSLVELQKGEFAIHIDGDLFKVIVKMPKYQGQTKQAEQRAEEQQVAPEKKNSFNHGISLRKKAFTEQPVDEEEQVQETLAEEAAVPEEEQVQETLMEEEPLQGTVVEEQEKNSEGEQEK